MEPTVAAMRTEGDAALRRSAKMFDGVTAATMNLRASDEEFEFAFANFAPAMIERLRFSIENIRRFHEAQKPEEMWMKEMRPRVWAGDRMLPIETIACYLAKIPLARFGELDDQAGATVFLCSPAASISPVSEAQPGLGSQPEGR
jgi:histidinol dehydrogenase